MLKRFVVPILLLLSVVGVAIGANDFYSHGSFPSPSSPATSASMRAELDLISAGFDKFPVLGGNNNKPVIINAGATGLSVTTGTLTLAGNFAISGAFATTLTVNGATNVTLPTTGTLATRAGAETFTNKTFAIGSNTFSGTTAQFNTALSDGDFATLAGSETLTNKTLTAPIITNPTLSGGGTLGGTYIGTYALAGTPTITAPAISSPVFSGSATGTYNLAGTPTIVAPTISSGTLQSTQVSASGVSSLAVPANKQLAKAIIGCTYANNGADLTNDLDFSACGAMDDGGVYWIETAPLTKRSDAAWVVGTDQGCLDTGAVGNSDYYLFTIVRTDTGVTDYLCSLSSTSPTMPADYGRKRLIGWFKRVGGTIVAFKTYELSGGGLELLWNVPTLDIDLTTTVNTTRRTEAVKVPLNFSVEAHLNVQMQDGSGAVVWISCPDQADTAPSDTAGPLSNLRSNDNATIRAQQLFIRTSATGLIAIDATTTIDDFRVSTMGFKWARRN